MLNADTHPSLSSRTILVVEDEVLLRLMVCDVLRDAGFRVIEAASADEAMACVQSDPRVDLVFTDVKMPGSMDGLALARRLKREFPHIQVVLASGHLLEKDLEPGTLLFTKPYPIEETAARVIAILDAKGSAP
jgi:CheY-like chemotaxis protein